MQMKTVYNASRARLRQQRDEVVVLGEPGEVESRVAVLVLCVAVGRQLHPSSRQVLPAA